eukprot:TRINITY_DN7113_c0_g1_i15.p1 TRINITY_DN7113_c0_g1~~TRINITY_DN7113_c0_g1_i15.p1  ORF type:complete len:279 (+),score=57.56 TRINITY_DN7113_c0_g1_i15:362-1198(+)
MVGCVSKSPQNVAYKVENVWFLSLKHRTQFSSEVKSLMSGISDLLKQGMYFSHTYDLTSTMKANLTHNSASLYDSAEKLYTWNSNLCKDFAKAGVSTGWLVPVIQGFVGVAEGEIGKKGVRIVLVSRRSTKMAGTRCRSRGLDDEGNAANTVETEQIVIYGIGNENITYSFDQIRGSVPVFWRQKSVFSKIKLTRTPELSFPAFAKHFDNLIKHYKRVIIINLLSDKKEGEVRLTRAYEANEAEYEKKTGANIRYCHFDFHSERSASVTIKRTSRTVT